METTKTKNVLILCEGDLSRDPRVQKQILSFKDKATIYTVANKASGMEDFFFEIYPKITTVKDKWYTKIVRVFQYFTDYMEYYTWRGDSNRQLLEDLRKTGIDFDLIIANELRTLPVAVKLVTKNTRLHFDAHELYLHDTMPNTVTEMYIKYDRHLLLRYAKKANTFSTVCKAIALEYKRLLNREIIVLENLPLFHNLLPRKVDSDEIKIIYHGIAMKNRSIDKIISAFSALPSNFSLYLALVPFEYEKETMEEIRSLAMNAQRVNLIDPFPMAEIPQYLNQYDISLCFFEKSTKSIEYALPNKFFEGIQARLCMAVSPNMEMKEIVLKKKLGVVSREFIIDELFKRISMLTADEIYDYKCNCDLVAKEYSFDTLRGSYNSLLS